MVILHIQPTQHLEMKKDVFPWHSYVGFIVLKPSSDHVNYQEGYWDWVPAIYRFEFEKKRKYIFPSLTGKQTLVGFKTQWKRLKSVEVFEYHYGIGFHLPMCITQKLVCLLCLNYFSSNTLLPPKSEMLQSNNPPWGECLPFHVSVLK